MPKKFSDLFYQLNDTVYVKKDKFLYCTYNNDCREYRAYFISNNTVDYISSEHKFDLIAFNPII